MLGKGPTDVDMAYVIAPFAGWVIAGTLKFTMYSVRTGRWAWDQMGLGGVPSTHVAVVSSTAALIGLREGVKTALFSLALTLVVIVILDAINLRREVGAHAAALNYLLKDDPRWRQFRESVGHRQAEVLWGLLVGLGCAWVVHVALP